MAVQETNGYLDVENATLRSSKVEVTSNLGIANTAPQHAFSVGSNLYIDTESSDVITVKGNVRTEGVKMGFIEITPSYDFAAVSNVGNVTANTIIFNNDNQGFVATGNATIGSTLTISGFRITAAAAAEDDLEAITTSTQDKPNAGKTENPIHLEGATAATSYTTGILQVGNSTNQGGMGVAGNVYVNQGVYTQDLSVENVVSNLAVNTDDLFVDIENSRVGIGKTEPTVALDVVGAVTASGGLTIGSNTAVNTDDLFVDTVNSRVGIGKTEPTVALDVAGAVTASGNMTVTGTSKVGIGTDTLDAVLNVGTGTPASGDQIIKLNTDSPWAFEHETNGLALRSSAANKKLYVQASDFSNVATFDVNGNNVGIGLTDPASKLHVMGDIIGRNVSNTHTITGSDGGSETFTLLPDQNRVVVTHVGSSTLDGAYTVNMTGGIPTIIGSILYLEIVSSKTNTDGASHTHSTTLQIAAATVLTTGSISVAAVNNPGDVYERTLRRTIILTSDGWKDYSVYPKLSVPTTDDAIIFSTTENTTQNDAGSDKPLVERLRITGNGNVGIGTNNPIGKLDVRGAILAPVVSYFSNQDAPYLIAGTSGYTGEATNWDTYGFQHRIKTNSSGVPRITVDTSQAGEAFSIVNNGNVGIGTTNPSKLLEISGASGLDNSSPVHFRITNTQQATSGNPFTDLTKPSGLISFYTPDTSTAGPGDVAGIGFRQESTLGGDTALCFYTNSENNDAGTPLQERMCISHEGEVGIGKTDPTRTLDVKGSFKVAPGNGTSFETNGQKVSSPNDNTNSGTTNHFATMSVTLSRYTTQTSRPIYFGSGDDTDTTFVIGTTGGAGGAGFTNTNLKVTGASYLYVKRVYANGSQVSSDDRLKINEEPIKNATKTILKLKPLVYDKYEKLGELTSNVFEVESGLMVQDVWYDTPELRHIVDVPDDAKPTETKEEDPEYTSWGSKPAYLTYTQLLPYIIKSIQEIHNEKGKLKLDYYGSGIDIDTHRGMIICNHPTVHLCNNERDPTCVGVLSDIDNSEVLLETRGVGNVWIINTNGNLNAGDYITTSTVSGYGQKQNSEFLANYTVAKILEPCNFTETTKPVKRAIKRLEDVTYYVIYKKILINEELYNRLPGNERHIETYTSLEDEHTTTDYYKLLRTESKHFREGAETITRQELVNVLDEHGQIQWEDTNQTEKAYKIRYLDADGNITDEANHVHKAAFVGCTYHCG